MKAEKGERRCFITGTPASKNDLIRFVIGPDHLVYPDITGKIDGRGVWLLPTQAVIEQAFTQKVFSKAFHEDVKPIADLPVVLAKLLKDRCLHLLGLANKAGMAVAGFDKLKEALRKENMVVLIEASDGAKDGHEKMERAVKDAFLCDDFTKEELGAAMGRDFCVHVGLKSGKMAQSFKNEVNRYRCFLGKEEGLNT